MCQYIVQGTQISSLFFPSTNVYESYFVASKKWPPLRVPLLFHKCSHFSLAVATRFNKPVSWNMIINAQLLAVSIIVREYPTQNGWLSAPKLAIRNPARVHLLDTLLKVFWYLFVFESFLIAFCERAPERYAKPMDDKSPACVRACVRAFHLCISGAWGAI